MVFCKKISEIDDDFKDSYKLDGKVLRSIQNETVRAVKQYEDKELEKKLNLLEDFLYQIRMEQNMKI